MTHNDIIRAIYSATFSASELREVIDAVKNVQAEFHNGAARKFSRGDKVSFLSKFGMPVNATIEKVNPKMIHVVTPGGARWRVPAGMLKSV